MGEFDHLGQVAKKAAKTVGVSHRSVKAAKKIRREAAPEVIAAIESGNLTL